MEPLISVIIPYYKADQYIDKCVGSILSQTIKDIEIIIAVDIKDTKGKQNLETKKWPSVRVITGGNDVSANRNAGLNAAKGKYVFFIDADDFLIRDDAFEVMVNDIEGSNADVALGEFDFYFSEQGKFENGSRLSKSGAIDVPEALKMRFETGRFFVGVWNTFIKRDFIGDLRFDESMTVAEDGMFCLGLLKKKPKVYTAKGLVSYGYRKEGSYNSSAKSYIKTVGGWIHFLDEGKTFVESEYPELKDAMLKNYSESALHFLMNLPLRANKSDGTFKPGKKIYKQLRKKYLSFGKFPRKHLSSKREKIWDMLLRLNLLWRFYRIMRTLFPKKYNVSKA